MKTNSKTKSGFRASIVLLATVMTACSLDIEGTDSVITEGGSAVFNGVAKPADQLTSIYNGIRDQTGDQGGLYALTEVTTDELLVPTRGTDWGDNGVWRTLHVHTYNSTHSMVLGVWNDKNSAVLRCTEIIDDKTTATTVQKAEAKFARAYNMWIVLDFWRQVPFRNPQDGPDVLPTVKTPQESYQMIVKDLEDAIAGLPDSDPTASDKSRPVKSTARFLLAKVKLNAKVYLGSYGTSDLDDVIDLVDEIEADGYGLVNNYFQIFKGSNVSNSDVIWSVAAGVGNRMWNGLHYNQSHTGNGGGGWNGFTTLSEFYDKFEDNGETTNEIGGDQEERRGYTHTLASTNSTNQGFGFGFQVGQMYGWRDLDGSGPNTTEGAVALKTRTGSPLVFTKEIPGLTGNNEVTGIRLLKYSPANGAFTSGVVMARFADAHLMRAEAMLRKGQDAIGEINELRSFRSNTPPLTGPLTEAMLLDERGRELYTEGWRRNDLIRFGKYNSAKQFMQEESDDHTIIFPIPEGALLSNPNLVQNPGY